ncbi:MAG: sugar phosphate isomerase/epimerase [Chloroflexales bacterium]|nr:sugar phosphate isomerase/epimerase [Chloroflexales bacterium]
MAFSALNARYFTLMQPGLWLEIRARDDLGRLLDRVAAMGFSSLHAHFPEGCDAALARRLARASAGSGLAIAAASGYANPLRPSEAPMGSTLEQLAGLIELLPGLGARRVVSWSGTFAPGLLDDHPDNHTQVGWDALRASVDELFPLLDEAEAILLLEPYFTHVLNGPEAVARLCAEVNSPYLGVVLDPPDTWARQAELIPAGVAAIAPYVGLVHLKDVRPHNGRPGGPLDTTAFLEALSTTGISAPVIIEHVTLEQAAAARSFVLSHASR